MKQAEFDIFKAEVPRVSRRARKSKEAKKAPMIVDSYAHETNGKAVETKGADVKNQKLKADDKKLGSENREQRQSVPRIHTVSEITSRIKALIEKEFVDVWLTGEITDFRNRTGRHLYFALKDEHSKIRAVVFNAESRKIPFELKDGLEIICHGGIDIYAPQGGYSVIIDFMEPKGIGAFQLAFEQLKKKLETEGLFDRAHKKPLPYLPRKIGVVTSPTGAAIRDIVHVLTRRFPNIEILLYPVRVQGDGAAEEIAYAIRELNMRRDIDVMIVGRGGGSIEDLWAFNEEIVARAIYASRIPVISAVGHEIDFTIADFVADVRAATPSAAAEIVVPVKEKLAEQLKERRSSLIRALRQFTDDRKNYIGELRRRLKDPRSMLPDYWRTVDGMRERLVYSSGVGFEKRLQQIAKLSSNLSHLSPLNILAKGYSVVRRAGSGESIRSSGLLKIGDELDIIFHDGHAGSKVTKV